MNELRHALSWIISAGLPDDVRQKAVSLHAAYNGPRIPVLKHHALLSAFYWGKPGTPERQFWENVHRQYFAEKQEVPP